MEQHLIHVLRNGYTHFNTDGTQELIPPNRYMLRAAKEIESLLSEVQSMRGNYAMLMAERDQLIKENESLRTTSTSTTTVPKDTEQPNGS